MKTGLRENGFELVPWTITDELPDFYEFELLKGHIYTEV